MKTAEEIIRENCNVEYSKITGEEIVNSSLAAVCIAVDEYTKQFSNSSYEQNKSTLPPVSQLVCMCNGTRLVRLNRINDSYICCTCNKPLF